ncbi:hypothetical protein L0F63_005697 [Massospora cicadina]|nr:hypothetical protein L0F63_005697 [Massospora cicadina]
MASIKRQVTVIGGSSYIGLHLVSQLLESGVKVNATTRSSTKALEFLRQKHKDALHLFEANVLEKETLLESLKGSEAVFHLAAPVKIQVKDSYEEMIRPAVEGTRNVLAACLEVNSINTIIATSSVCTVHSRFPKVGYVYNEKDYYEADLKVDYPYIQAKIEAERCLWEFDHQHKDRFRVVGINPSFVFGPEFLGDEPNVTLNSPRSNLGKDLLKPYLTGLVKEIPRGGVNSVDVRDVALAHLRAYENPNAIGRFIITAEFSTWEKMLTVMSEILQSTSLPKVIEPIDSGNWVPVTIDNAKSKTVLKMEYIPIHKSLKDFIHQLSDFI